MKAVVTNDYVSSRLNMYQSRDHCACCLFLHGNRDTKTLLGVIKELDKCLFEVEQDHLPSITFHEPT